jgi:3-oxoadipate enol-lactonase
MNSLKLEDWNLYYEEAGAGDPVVLVHGMGSDHTVWNGILPLLEGEYRVLAVDLRGHGLSGKNPGQCTLKSFARDLIMFLDMLNIEKAHFIGHSMGGAVLMKLAIHHPERIRSLVLISSFAYTDNHLNRTLTELLKTLPSGYDAFFDACLKFTYTPKFVEKNRNEFRKIKTINSKTVSIQVLEDTINVCLNVDLLDDLKNIETPTLIIAGKKDGFTPPRHGIAIKNAVQSGKFIQINGVGHNLPVEKPEDTYLQIGDFLKIV